MERGLQSPPKSRTKLEEYANALGIDMDSDAWLDFCDLASVDARRITDRDEQVVSKLPLLFRTPGNHTLDEIIERIKRA